MTRPLASLSLDLDDQWTYLKTHGDPGWESAPSYLNVAVPRVLDLLRELNLRITWFVVGRDAADPAHAGALRSLTTAGHEVGNHSFHHEPWLHLYTEAEIEAELTAAENAIAKATGVTPAAFRGPGFSFSPTLLTVLARRGYAYDASTFPTFLGPLARLYYFAASRHLSREERKKRGQLFGRFREGLRPLAPYRWATAAGPLLEIPVTTLPIVRVPIHLSYLVYLDGYSRPLAKGYWTLALWLCRACRVEPSILLHPLDFLGRDDTDRLAFFPAMQRPAAPKLAFARWALGQLAKHYEVVPMGEHAAAIEARLAAKRGALAVAPS